MVAHDVTLSPLESPVAYLWFAEGWISSLICIGVSLYFYRRGHGAWWLLVAFAFAVPLLAGVITPLAHGLPPLPFGRLEEIPPSAPVPAGMTGGTTYVLQTAVTIPTFEPLLAIAFFWGYLQERRRLA